MLRRQMAMEEQSWAAIWPEVALSHLYRAGNCSGESRELKVQLPARHSSEGPAQGRRTSS